MTTRRAMVATFDAVGGPSKLVKAPGDRYYAGPTDAGTYRVSHCGKHSSPSYPMWSKIRWGSEIKEEGGEIMVMHDKKWQPLKTLSPLVTRDVLMRRNEELYGKREVPKKWLFNDFGHMTCYFYKDRNNNKKRDKDEQLNREYFHTTPDDEAASAAGRPITLSTSHGCIHLKPDDIDEMIAKGYFKSSNKVVVHGYKAKVPAAWADEPTATAPFEVHFFPGENKVVVTGILKPSRKKGH
jgi:L,D-transpeptidase catalytic domain